MRHIVTIVLCLLSAGVLTAQEVKPARLQGKITDFKGGNVILFNYETLERDTIPVDDNDSFDYTIFQDKLARTALYFDKHGCSADLFIENGMEANLGISFRQKEFQGMLLDEVVLDYQGDNADCTEFYKNCVKIWMHWPFTRIDTLTFAEYREGYLEDFDAQKGKLMKVKSAAFRKMMSEAMDAEVPNNLFRYAWSKPKKDADFERWVESFDRNDLANMELSRNYIRYYGIWHPKAEGEPYGIY